MAESGEAVDQMSSSVLDELQGSDGGGRESSREGAGGAAVGEGLGMGMVRIREVGL